MVFIESFSAKDVIGYTRFVGEDCYGNDIRGPIFAGDVKCKDMCDELQECVAFVLQDFKEGRLMRYKCWLKSACTSHTPLNHTYVYQLSKIY